MGRNAGIPGLIIFICGMIGLIFAVVEYTLYSQEWLLHYYIQTSADLSALMGVTILIWIVIGGVLAAITQ